MTGSRLALVADDAGLAAAVESRIQQSNGLALFTCNFAGIRDHLSAETDGLLVLAAATASDAQAAVRLVQEIALRKWAPQVVVLVTPEASLTLSLGTSLSAGRVQVLRWPDEMPLLAQRLCDQHSRGCPFTADEPTTLEEVIVRRLRNWTPSLLPAVDRIALAASHDVTVLLTGETGTGKTHLAKLIHDCSPRKNDRFLVVPCGALSANLVESEFFGHAKGAFTGADRAKLGKFAAAGNGTLLLDEIDALGLEQQANLLRVIETGEFEPVGSNETQQCTARIIVASNWDLEEAVESGKFRRDLYYRLNVMSFHLPSLHERVQDIGSLARGMAARYSAKFQKGLLDISPEALAALEAFPWPGNIRQLENVVQQAVLVSSGPELLLRHLPQPVQAQNATRPSTGLAPVTGLGYTAPVDSLFHNREVTERAVIQRALQTCAYSRARAAHSLGISRVTLYKKMKKYGLMEVPLQSVRA